MLKYFVYVIENCSDKSWYIGYTSDINNRLVNHNTHSGGEYTKKRSDKWKMIYYEAYINKTDALSREKFLKSGSGRVFIKKQIKNYLAHP